MLYILTKQLLGGGEYSKCIVILQELDLDFDGYKLNKSLVFIEFLCNFPILTQNMW